MALHILRVVTVDVKPTMPASSTRYVGPFATEDDADAAAERYNADMVDGVTVTAYVEPLEAR